MKINKKRVYKFTSCLVATFILAGSLFHCNSIYVDAKGLSFRDMYDSIKEKHVAGNDITIYELSQYSKQFFNFAGEQLGVYFNGSTQKFLENYQAFTEYMQEKYKNGYDGEDWNATKYFTKEIVRNSDGTFTMSDAIMDDTTSYIKKILDENNGYYLVSIPSLKNIEPSIFKSKILYDEFVKLVKSNPYVYIIKTVYMTGYMEYSTLSNELFVCINNTPTYFNLYDCKTWQSKDVVTKKFDGLTLLTSEISTTNSATLSVANGNLQTVVSEKGGYIKVYKNVDAMQNAQVGFQPYNATEKYVNYNYDNDNSVTVGEDYINGDFNQINQQHYDDSTTIVNNYYNSNGGITESQLNQLMEEFFNKLQGNNDGSGGSGGGSGGGGGGGVGSVLEGIGKLLDFLLELVGKIIGLFSEFASSLLGLLDKLTFFTDDFAKFLTSCFGFVPEELWTVVIAGMTAVIFISVLNGIRGGK